MSALLPRLARLNWRVIGAALIAVGIVHICATLAVPAMTSNSAYGRLAGNLPANTMEVLPQVTADRQPLPFMIPDFRYALCRLDASRGPATVAVLLPDRGWTVSVYGPEGESLYAATGQLGRPTEITFELAMADERFAGLTPEAQGRTRARERSAVVIPAREGLVVVRAPERGQAFRQNTEVELRGARCESQLTVAG